MGVRRGCDGVAGEGRGLDGPKLRGYGGLGNCTVWSAVWSACASWRLDVRTGFRQGYLQDDVAGWPQAISADIT